MLIRETPRLRIRRMVLDDAPFLVQLLNDRDFVNFIGDRDVRTIEDARGYLETGPLASYTELGFGLYVVRLSESDTPIGICGLIQRDMLADVDIGFAFLPAYRGRGYALEASRAVLEHGRDDLRLDRIVALTAPENEPSQKLLERLGYRYERNVRIAADGDECKLFVPS